VKPRRILIPTADYPPIEGGISSVALHVSRELAQMGHEVTVVAPNFPGMEEFDRSEPVEVIRFGGYRLGWFRFLPMACRTWPFVKTSDLILGVNISYGGIIGRWASARFGTPYITFGYAYEFLKFRRTPLVGSLLRGAYNRSSKAVAISDYTRENLEAFGVRPDRIATILPGAPPAQPLSDQTLADARRRFVVQDKHVILSVGRLIPRKNQVALVEAMPRILEAVPDATLVLVGRGPSMSDCCRAANTLKVREHVLLPGYVNDVDLAALYQICKVFALPTLEHDAGQVEGFGLVFAEAHSYGKAVVAGHSGGVADAVLHDETGVVVDGDDSDALADAIITLLKDEALAQRLGEAGKKRVEKDLNWTAFTKRMMAEVSLDP
jgi:phosphatidylinositol alpha-1,6-mannosyltransferase